jgi:glutamyl-tRNA synthetase
VAARFSEKELEHLSARTLHAMPYEAVHGNLTKLADASIWSTVVRGPIAPLIEEEGFLADAAKALPAEPWTEATWKTWTGAVSAASGCKGRGLFHPPRLAGRTA